MIKYITFYDYKIKFDEVRYNFRKLIEIVKDKKPGIVITADIKRIRVGNISFNYVFDEFVSIEIYDYDKDSDNDIVTIEFDNSTIITDKSALALLSITNSNGSGVLGEIYVKLYSDRIRLGSRDHRTGRYKRKIVRDSLEIRTSLTEKIHRHNMKELRGVCVNTIRFSALLYELDMINLLFDLGLLHSENITIKIDGESYEYNEKLVDNLKNVIGSDSTVINIDNRLEFIGFEGSLKYMRIREQYDENGTDEQKKRYHIELAHTLTEDKLNINDKCKQFRERYSDIANSVRGDSKKKVMLHIRDYANMNTYYCSSWDGKDDYIVFKPNCSTENKGYSTKQLEKERFSVISTAVY